MNAAERPVTRTSMFRRARPGASDASEARLAVERPHTRKACNPHKGRRVGFMPTAMKID